MGTSIKNPVISDETVDLLRGGDTVRSLFGSFGALLRETRLTGILGYLIAQEPGPWRRLFHIHDPLSLVRVEFSQKTGRADIWLESASESIVVEAKITRADPTGQSRKYKADRAVLISDHFPHSNQLTGGNLYFNWIRITSFLQSEYHEATKGRPHLQFLAKEVIRYMAENNLVRLGSILEVYVREINHPATLTLFLKGHLYTCPYQKAGKAGKAIYFAPHFGQRLAKTLPGIYSGISFVAKIKAVEVLNTWNQFRQAVKKHRGARWLNTNREIVTSIRKELRPGNEQKTFLFLFEPRLVFNPPINKNLLQEGSGFLSKRAFAFDELFEAWGKSGSAKI